MVTFDQTFIPAVGMELHFHENAKAESSPVHWGIVHTFSLISAAALSFCSGHCQPETTQSVTH